MARQDQDGPSQEERDAEVALATRYVLGELSDEEFADFEARYASDPGFRDRYDQWAQDISQPDEAPGDGGEDATLRARSTRMIQELGVVPAAIGALCAALLVVFASKMGWLGHSSDVLVAQLSPIGGDGQVVAFAEFDIGAPRLVLELRAEGPETGVYEVWLVGEDGAPLSLGVLAAGASTLTFEPSRPEEMAQGVLVITAEPVGGAGPAGPTGETVAAGAFAPSP